MTPRFHAGPIGLYEACDAAYARELELAWFCADAGIPGLDAEQPLDDGVRLMPVLSQVPFGSSKHGVGRRGDLSTPAVERIAEDRGFALQAGDVAFVKLVIGRRDRLIERMLEQCIADGDTPSAVELYSHPSRLMAEIPLGQDEFEPIEGRLTSHTIAVVRDSRGQPLRALVVDYKQVLKTGDRSGSTEATNVELRTLAILTAAQWPDVHDVTVSRASRANLEETSDAVEGHTYSIDDLGGDLLDRLANAVRRSINRAAPLFDSGSSQLPPAHQAQLDDAATMGAHCLGCQGKMCCGKVRDLRVSAEADHGALVARDVLREAKQLCKQQENTEDTAEGRNMDIDRLISTSKELAGFAEKAKIVEATRKDVNALIRQLISGGQQVPGHSLKAGAPTISVREVDDKPLTPTQTWRMLREQHVIPLSVTREEFLAQTSVLSATSLRAFLADTLRAPEGEIPAKLKALLGDQSPLQAGAKSPSVIVDRADVVERVEGVEIGPKGRKR